MCLMCMWVKLCVPNGINQHDIWTCKLQWPTLHDEGYEIDGIIQCNVLKWNSI